MELPYAVGSRTWEHSHTDSNTFQLKNNPKFKYGVVDSFPSSGAYIMWAYCLKREKTISVKGHVRTNHHFLPPCPTLRMHYLQCFLFSEFILWCLSSKFRKQF